MNKFTRDLIEYHGISEYPKYVELFNQMNVDSIMTLPIQKPDIEQIIKVWVTNDTVYRKIFTTPKGMSLEGQNLTGKTLFLCGDLNIKVEYAAYETTQGIYSCDTTLPFATCIVLPSDFNDSSVVNTNIIIEDIFSIHLDKRSVYTNVTMMVIANVC